MVDGRARGSPGTSAEATEYHGIQYLFILHRWSYVYPHLLLADLFPVYQERVGSAVWNQKFATDIGYQSPNRRLRWAHHGDRPFRISHGYRLGPRHRWLRLDLHV